MKPLEEKDFIHEEYGRNPFPFWGWLSVVLFVTLLFFGASRFYFSTLAELYSESPFLQVTNREMSLFLWQNPQHMRVHVKIKNGYLPAFEYAEKIGLTPQYADDYVIAPPELFFQYHTWKRLLGNVDLNRPIPADEFRTFLTAVSEWAPKYWKKAPESYVTFVNALPEDSKEDLSTVNNEILPLEVRQAFIGWRNYFFEGNQINALQPKAQLLEQLLSLYPHYARNYWCNIIGDTYLKTVYDNSELAIKSNELSPFLRAALFNLDKVNEDGFLPALPRIMNRNKPLLTISEKFLIACH